MFLVFLLLLLPTTVQGQTSQNFLTDRLPQWELGMGAIGLNLPDYPGSTNKRYRGAAFPYFIYRGDVVRADDEGTRARLISSKYHELGLSFGFNFPVNSNDNPSRVGMPDLDALISLGPRLLFRLIAEPKSQQLNFTLAARGVYSTKFSFNNMFRSEGYVFEPHISYWYRWAESKTTLFSAFSVEFGTAKYNAFFYNVSPSQITPNRPPYQSRSGLVETSTSLGLSQKVLQNVFGFTAISWRNLDLAVNRDSPLVETTDNVGVILGLIWTFYESEELAFRPSQR